MEMIRMFILVICITSIRCTHQQNVSLPGHDANLTQESSVLANPPLNDAGNEALLLTRFSSFDQLKSVVQIHFNDTLAEGSVPQVTLIHRSGDREVTSVLRAGISQSDFMRAGQGSLFAKAKLGLQCPYAFIHRKDLERVENLGRRRPWVFGKGDVAFYDLAETMVQHIATEDRKNLSAEDLSEKGFLNTFNHITAQAFMTSLYDEQLADFVADVHELFNMPALVTGNFTEAQLTDIQNGPVDNYVDMINNEWGQELGKVLGRTYKIDRQTVWTPRLLANYLNDIQIYQGWVFRIGFAPFQPEDVKVIQFVDKINKMNQRNGV